MEEKFNNVDILEVNVGEFKQDYTNLKLEKERVHAEKMLELDSRVEIEMQAMRLAVIDKIKATISDEIDKEFGSKLDFYEKYFFVPIVEIKEELASVVEEEVIEDVNTIQEVTDTVLI